jgi:hypothetical protein
MITSSINPWQRRRSAFNHDWLKNQYLTALGSWLNLLDSKITDPVLEMTFVKEIFPQWESISQEALSLAYSFEQEMSPRCLFDRLPLLRCDKQTKCWLGDTMHNLWIARYKVQELVHKALLEVEKADTVYAQLQRVLQDCEDIQSVPTLRVFREQFAEFRACCQGLAKVVEGFPNGIKVI